RRRAGRPPSLTTSPLHGRQRAPAGRTPRARAQPDARKPSPDHRPIRARPVGAPERLVKWVCRHPAVAGLLAIVVVVTLLGFGGVAWQGHRAQQERDDALRARDEAEAAKLGEEEERKRAESRWYLNQMARVQHEYLANNAGQARRLLQECRARTPGLCQWEWDYMRRQCHAYLLSLPKQALNVWSVSYSPCGR